MTEPVSGGRTQDRALARRRLALAAGLFVLTAASVVIFAASKGILLPSPQPRSKRLTDVLSQTINTQGIDAGVAQYRSLRERGFPELFENEYDTNRLGYRLLRKGERESAIQVFQLNAETHPKFANVYEGLGDAYLAAGNKALAIENYRQALALDPNKKFAATALANLTGIPRKPYPPLLLFHICSGILGLLSGAAAMAFRKGSRWHRMAGNVFFPSMVSLAATAAYLGNVFGGAVAFYLVTTAWVTARRRDGETSIFDWGGLLVALAGGAVIVTNGLKVANSPTGPTDGVPVGMYFFLGSVVLLAAAGDARMLVRGGVFGAHRIVRHLWRMCFSLFIATGSFFLGQQQVFPVAWRGAAVWFVPALLPLVLMIFWLFRVRFTNAYKGTAFPYRTHSNRAAFRKQALSG